MNESTKNNRYEVAIRRWIEHPPKDARDGHTLFNAPREMYGSKGNRWTGDCRGGVFYAAVDPHDEDAEQWIEHNVRMAGDVMEFVTAAEIKEWAYREAREQDYSRDDVDTADPDKLQAWFLDVRGRVKGEILYTAKLGWHVVALDTLKDRLAEIINTVEEQCEPDRALDELNAIIAAGVPERAAHHITKAQREIDTGNPYTAGVYFLQEAIRDIGETKA